MAGNTRCRLSLAGPALEFAGPQNLEREGTPDEIGQMLADVLPAEMIAAVAQNGVRLADAINVVSDLAERLGGRVVIEAVAEGPADAG